MVPTGFAPPEFTALPNPVPLRETRGIAGAAYRFVAVPSLTLLKSGVYGNPVMYINPLEAGDGVATPDVKESIFITKST